MRVIVPGNLEAPTPSPPMLKRLGTSLRPSSVGFDHRGNIKDRQGPCPRQPCND